MIFWKKKKKAKASRPKAVRQPKRLDPAALARRKRIRQLSLGAVVSAAVVLGVIAAVILLQERMLEEVPVSRVIVADPPEWLDEAAIEEIQRLALEVARENPTDRKLAEKVSERLKTSLWVKSTPPGSVINNYDGSVSIRCEYRKPLAIVGAGGVWVRVDRDAMVLPGRFLRSGIAAGKYREVVGVKSDPPAAGVVWTAEDLLAAVDVLRLIDGEPYTSEITGIDVSNYRGRISVAKAHIVLTTEAQSRINWGRAVGTEGRVEVNYEIKLHNLEELFIRHGSLNKLEYADLRGQKVMFRLRGGE